MTPIAFCRIADNWPLMTDNLFCHPERSRGICGLPAAQRTIAAQRIAGSHSLFGNFSPILSALP